MENIDKVVIKEELDKLNDGIESKPIQEIVSWITHMYGVLDNFREPYRCHTCKLFPCSAYRDGCRDCSGWR